jgi:hypothetical protein
MCGLRDDRKKNDQDKSRIDNAVGAWTQWSNSCSSRSVISLFLLCYISPRKKEQCIKISIPVFFQAVRWEVVRKSILDKITGQTYLTIGKKKSWVIKQSRYKLKPSANDQSSASVFVYPLLYSTNHKLSSFQLHSVRCKS